MLLEYSKGRLRFSDGDRAALLIIKKNVLKKSVMLETLRETVQCIFYTHLARDVFSFNY